MIFFKNKYWKKIMKILIRILLGGLLGFLYYKIIGCRTGSCPITSNPWISTLYGALTGLIIGLF